MNWTITRNQYGGNITVFTSEAPTKVTIPFSAAAAAAAVVVVVVAAAAAVVVVVVAAHDWNHNHLPGIIPTKMRFSRP